MILKNNFFLVNWKESIIIIIYFTSPSCSTCILQKCSIIFFYLNIRRCCAAMMRYDATRRDARLRASRNWIRIICKHLKVACSNVGSGSRWWARMKTIRRVLPVLRYVMQLKRDFFFFFWPAACAHRPFIHLKMIKRTNEERTKKASAMLILILVESNSSRLLLLLLFSSASHETNERM